VFRLLILVGAVATVADSAWAQDAKGAAAPPASIEAESTKFAQAFNKGDVDALASQFLPDGELIDETGTVYQGRQEISGLLSAFFEKFAGAQVDIDVESIRTVGPMSFEEGTRIISTDKEDARNNLRYVAIRLLTKEGWRIASLRDFEEPVAPTPHDLLQPLAWLVGNWVNEGDDARIEISYRWSDDKNYLVGTYRVQREGKTIMDSQQRIGWDPVAGQARSWLFDSDGGFAEGRWTELDGAWMIKSVATLPDGLTGSATVTMTPQGDSRFVMKGADRISGGERLDDFEVVVTKLPEVKK
jgi:uncharacterized protein (TIGR02246 family)